MNLRMRRIGLQVLEEDDIAQRLACEIGNDILDGNRRAHPVSLGPQAGRRQD
jgi:hypothetical protein